MICVCSNLVLKQALDTGIDRSVSQQGPGSTPQTEQDKQHQQQAKAQLRQNCSVGHQPGYFALVSEQWGAGLQILQTQRNKRKAAQAFDNPSPGEHKHVCVTSAA